ncbi:beta-1,6-N-acetylglucosaminyltransferase [Sphingobacterium rhinopitheci]|uniref:beta-1,6-N-acetylglucosaminyltransferase n=1 Tax=Sphingobacterium rhinopitheci TaxID=2781960 RepID=UPI001F5270C9|nr:beta-1,6-N-acetylglucosaminyltransferase [Sphingobacterium rhinopitheci]MCI0920757.1 glycosyl transferase [Sphingobacterium rhinopitheci]
MKHAYLIMAHNEFEVLQCLVSSLDDSRNDIFIHFDKKLRGLPDLKVENAKLYILEHRVDVRWGHVSQMKAMYNLMEKAMYTDNYKFFHLFSGVHLPLYNQDYLHAYFDKHKVNNFLMKMPTNEREVSMKMKRYHFFIKNFIHPNRIIQRIDQLCWLVLLKVQDIFGFKRNKEFDFHKASQWGSLNYDAIDYLIQHKNSIVKKYALTFCCDEFFISSELERSPLRPSIMYTDKLLKCDFNSVSPRIYQDSDYSYLQNSGCLFARKFSKSNFDLVLKIISNLKSSS